MRLARTAALTTALIGLFAVAAYVGASPITTLFNTGVGSAGVPLPDNTLGDPHYLLVAVPPGSVSDLRIRTSVSGYPIPPYVGDNALSAWIGPNNDALLDGYAGIFQYRTTFDLTGYDPSSATIAGLWSTDNDGADILINGASLGFVTPFEGFRDFYPFAVTTGFVAGANTLDFLVHNLSGIWTDPTALRVEVTGTANPLPAFVPEPATLALLGLGLIGLAASRRPLWKA